MRTTSRRRLMASAVLCLSVLVAGCDPGRAMDGGEEVETAPTLPAMAVEGHVVNAATGAPVAGARVQVSHVGSGSTDESGAYRFGEVGALVGLKFLSLRVEAPGYAPADRRVNLVNGRASMPAVRLTPLAPAIPLGPGGGELAFASGVRVLAPAGAVGAGLGVSVTLLAQGGYEPIEPEKPSMAFHVSLGGTRFTRPVRISVPLQEPAPPLAPVPLYSFDAETGSWIDAGSATVSMDGGFVDVPIEEGETYAFPLVVDWGSEQVDTRDTTVYVTAKHWRCMPANTMDAGYADPNRRTGFKTSVSPTQFPNFHAHLKGMYDRADPVTYVVLGPYATDRQVYAKKRFTKHWRKGRVWHLSTPNSKTTYTYEWYEFKGWVVTPSECDLQGLVV
jgi:hypothetical protein